MPKTKYQRLVELTEIRRTTVLPGYSNVGDFQGGIYDGSYVSPYTKSACNVDSKLFILLQDWASGKFLGGQVKPQLAHLGRDPQLPTNRNLERLLRQHFDRGLEEVYATNLFPFIKPAGMSSSISSRDLVWAAKTFALPQIAIVQPRLVVALGLGTFNALRRACGHRPIPSLSTVIQRPFDIDVTRIWCQAHTGSLGQNNRNRGGINRVTTDWETMKRWYDDGP